MTAIRGMVNQSEVRELRETVSGECCPSRCEAAAVKTRRYPRQRSLQNNDIQAIGLVGKKSGSWVQIDPPPYGAARAEHEQDAAVCVSRWG